MCPVVVTTVNQHWFGGNRTIHLRAQMAAVKRKIAIDFEVYKNGMVKVFNKIIRASKQDLSPKPLAFTNLKMVINRSGVLHFALTSDSKIA